MFLAKGTTKINLGGRHSTVDPSTPTILQPWVRIPAQHPTFFQFI